MILSQANKKDEAETDKTEVMVPTTTVKTSIKVRVMEEEEEKKKIRRKDKKDENKKKYKKHYLKERYS
jgi:hypothetical protein